MSFTAAHEFRRARYTCQRCRDRQARFRHRREVKADRDHTLCFECFRSERNRQRAQRLADTASARLPHTPFLDRSTSGVVDARQITHRRAMLAHCERNQPRPAP